MKRFISIAVMMLVVLSLLCPVFAAEPNIESFDKDIYKNEILALTDDIVVHVNQVIEDENREKLFTKKESLPLITADDIDFSKMYKKYLFAGDILDAKSNDEILSILSEKRYMWILLVYVEDIVIEVTFDKNFDFEGYENVGDIPFEEKLAIIDEKGSYGIETMAILVNDDFYTVPTANGKMTYFVSLDTAGTAGAIQLSGKNKCSIYCEKGDAEGRYVDINRIEPETGISGRLTGLLSYTLTEPAFPWEAVVASAAIIAVAVTAIVYILVIRKKRITA